LLDVQFGHERALALLDGGESVLEADVVAGVGAVLAGSAAPSAAPRMDLPALAAVGNVNGDRRDEDPAEDGE